MAGISQFISYPAYFVEVTLNASSDNPVPLAFWMSDFSALTEADGSGNNFESVSGQGPTNSRWESGLISFGTAGVVYSSLTQAVTTWANNFDWDAAANRIPGTFTPTVKVTRFTEASQDVTPTP